MRHTSEYAWRLWSVFRFTSLLRDFLPLCLRAGLLVAGLTFAYRDLSAEWKVAALFNGVARSPEAWFRGADEAVAAFPFDQHIRMLRMAVRQRVMEQVNAQRQPSPAPIDGSGSP